ncbi:MAG: sigma-70 family RNA polymerase sigma factor [Bacteroidota bacterium]
MGKVKYVEELAALRQGDQTILKKIYEAHRKPFIDWAMARFQVKQEEAADVFQDTMVAFYENVVEGKVVELRSQMRTYLFGIGRFMLLARFRERKKEIEWEEEDWRQVEADAKQVKADYSIQLNDRQAFLQEAIAALGQPCQQLLVLFYYQRFTTEAIMMEMGYQSTDVVKSQKARCMKTLKMRFKSGFSREGI